MVFAWLSRVRSSVFACPLGDMGFDMTGDFKLAPIGSLPLRSNPRAVRCRRQIRHTACPCSNRQPTPAGQSAPGPSVLGGIPVSHPTHRSWPSRTRHMSPYGHSGPPGGSYRLIRRPCACCAPRYALPSTHQDTECVSSSAATKSPVLLDSFNRSRLSRHITQIPVRHSPIAAHAPHPRHCLAGVVSIMGIPRHCQIATNSGCRTLGIS